jgi:hypothetical protein
VERRRQRQMCIRDRVFRGARGEDWADFWGI